MSIPATITDALTSLEAQVAAATPLANASHATVTALQLNAANLVTSIQTELTKASLLDTWAASSDPNQLIDGVVALTAAADDQRDLSLMRGVVGRAASNLDQL